MESTLADLMWGQLSRMPSAITTDVGPIMMFGALQFAVICAAVVLVAYWILKKRSHRVTEEQVWPHE